MARNSYLYPSYVVRDPLLYLQYMPQVLRANETIARIIDYNVLGDPFLSSYITKLDEEIYAEIPDFTDMAAAEIWEDYRLHLLFSEATDEMRKHGWCVVQFYETISAVKEGDEVATEVDENASVIPDEIDYKVFSGRHFIEWLTKPDEDGRLERIGVKVRYYDDLSNNYEEELIFGPEQQCFLFTWKKSKTGRRYAEPDLTQAIMTLAYNIRQINGQLAFIGIKPGFKHFVYGDSKDKDFSTSFKGNMQYVDRSAGIGAKETQLKEIRDISNGDISKIELSLDKQIKFFAGTTRLPLRFYIGQREKGGLGQAAESEDEVRLANKKKFIFDIVRPYIQDIFLYVFGLNTVINMNFQSDVLVKEEVESVSEDIYDSKGES